MKKSLLLAFWALVGSFFFILSEFFISAVRELFRGSELFLLPLIIFFLLGILLIFLTLKKKVEGVLKKFLLLTGASATGFFFFVFLHNAFYALGTITSYITVLNYLIEVFHIVFFIIAIFVCPLGFLVGAGGTIVLFFKKRNRF
ncbi:hypothetical protein AMJ49_02915 [Parcubacteria bacterium DG_74_2]|nr:MAG: hypothetical protein AMJ49_02915 [Parcubacteria bacterium DG_74_2]